MTSLRPWRLCGEISILDKNDILSHWNWVLEGFRGYMRIYRVPRFFILNAMSAMI